MSYQLQKGYIERNYENFKKDSFLNLSEDLMFTYFTLGCLFPELDAYSIDDDIITDGGEDKQIDSIYLVPERNEINLVQVKKSNGNFSSNTIIQISNGVDWFLNQDTKNIENINNIKFKEKILEAREMEGLTWDSSMKINVYYCNLANSEEIGKEVEDEKNKFNSEYKRVWPNFNFSIIGVKEYYESLKTLESENIDYDLEITDKNSKIEYDIDENIRGLVVTVSTVQIAELAKKYKEKLFDQNIRFSLGVKNKVNNKIRETVTTDKNQFFWYFNNGITIICDKFSLINNPNKNIVNLKNLQIVNGCQTSTTLFDAYEKGELKDSYVIVKIFSSSDKEFINNITVATNSQTSIESRDLVANDPLQDLIKRNLGPKYFYEHKRNQYKGVKIPDNKRVNNGKLGQAVMSIILKSPGRARGNRNSIFSDEYYKRIFDRSIEQLLLCYLIFNYAENRRNQVVLDSSVESQVTTYGTFHISRIIGQVLFEDGIFSNKHDILSAIIESIEKDETYLDKYFEKSLDKLLEIIELFEVSNGKIVSYTNFFKTNSTDTLISNYMDSFN